ncbi:MAG: hypothetical protein C0417_11625 [Chlorobiaceae bacterium]|nr:hypothetical protein [Chlorobiaceae bacterium]
MNKLVETGSDGCRKQPTQEEVLSPGYTKMLDLQKQLGSHSGEGRHLLVFLDGTWNEDRTPIGEATPTNVLRMFHEIDKKPNPGKQPHIIARYYRGVGNRQDNKYLNRLWYGFNGEDEQRIRQAAFAGLYSDYKSVNDVIYIIGFSRGAASARLLARDLCKDGFPPNLEVETRHYPNFLTGQIEARIVWVRRHNECADKTVFPKVKFLGCWDTVDAFVLPSRFPADDSKDKVARWFKNIAPRLLGKERFRGDENQIPQKVEQAVHCVAIDETRNAFLPTLMPAAKNVEEVWFPGVHSDVGGGYGDNKLAGEAYDFMRVFLEKESKKENQIDPISFNSKGKNSESYCFHYHGLNTGMERTKEFFGFGTNMRKIRVLNGAPGAKPKIHSSIFTVIGNGNVFAANKKNKRTWRVTYDPYNFREFNDGFEIVDTERRDL